MVIPIPVGVKRVASVSGGVWKFVCCSKCKGDYAYLMEIEAVGVDQGLLFVDAEDSNKRALMQAANNFAKLSKNTVSPIPCPQCGHYQEDMVRLLKEEGPSEKTFIAGLILAAISLVPLVFDVRYIWIATAVGVTAGLAMMGYADWAKSRYDPNSQDVAKRIARGRRNALWGKTLELIANGSDVATDSQAIRPGRSQASDHGIKPV